MAQKITKNQLLDKMDEELRAHGCSRSLLPLHDMQALFSEIKEQSEHPDARRSDGFWSVHSVVNGHVESRREPHFQKVTITPGASGFLVQSLSSHREIVGEGDTVVRVVENFFTCLYERYYMVLEEQWDRELIGYIPQFYLDDSHSLSAQGGDISLYLKAVNLMVEVQCNQVDKSGICYYFHPMRVSHGCKTIAAKMVAVMHDVLEDTFLTPSELSEYGFPAAIIDGILSVTRKEADTYAEFIQEAAKNPLGKEVKLLDLRDNMDITRLKDITEKDTCRLRKYLHAFRFLKGAEKTPCNIVD